MWKDQWLIEFDRIVIAATDGSSSCDQAVADLVGIGLTWDDAAETIDRELKAVKLIRTIAEQSK